MGLLEYYECYICQYVNQKNTIEESGSSHVHKSTHVDKLSLLNSCLLLNSSHNVGAVEKFVCCVHLLMLGPLSAAGIMKVM